MTEHGTSYWRLKGTEKWVTEVRLTLPNGEIKKIQRRGDSKLAVRQIATNIINQAEMLGQNAGKKFTLKQLMEPYIEHKTHLVRPGTLGNYVHLLRTYAIPAFGSRSIQSLEPWEITEWLNTLRARQMTPNTVNTIRARLSDLLQFAVSRKYLVSNPVALVPPHRTRGQVFNVCSPWSADEVRTALAAFKGTQLDMFVSIAITTGMRKGEILALQWQDLDVQKRTIAVRKSRGDQRVLTAGGSLATVNKEDETKTQSSTRTMKMPGIVAEAARRAIATTLNNSPDGYVVLGQKGNRISQSMVRKIFDRTCADIGLRRIRIHDLRHTSAVLGLEAGAAIEEVSQGLGHSGVEITKRIYAPIVPKLADRFVDKLDAALADESTDQADI